MNLASLLERLKQRSLRLPDVAGVFFGSPQNGLTVCRTAGRLLYTEEFREREELLDYLGQAPLPRTVCAGFGELTDRAEFRRLAKKLEEQHESVIATDTGKVLGRLKTKDPVRDFLDCGFRLAGSAPSDSLRLALAAMLAGWYYHAGEYENCGERLVLPLPAEEHELFALLLQVPPGEVLALNNIVKYLGFQWTRDRVARELARLSPGSDVPRHRLVEKDGGMPGFIPAGVQRKFLAAEFVPFTDDGKADVKSAGWQRQKYRPLTNYLFYTGKRNWFFALKFKEMEKIMGGFLPLAAKKLGGWWMNEAPHAYIWKDAKCRVVDVNIQLETVAFKSSHTEERG